MKLYRLVALSISLTLVVWHTADAAPPNSEVINGKLYAGLSRYYELMSAGDFRTARNLLIVRFSPSDPNLQPLIADAEIKDYLRIINDPKAKRNDKNKALLDLAQSYPEQAKAYKNEVKRANDETEKERIRQAHRFEAEARKNGVSIGMSQEAVLMSNWGRPISRNRTTNQYGTHEQWVYGGGNYLYFENGVLTGIQN